ncbi:MAG TPA: hypothetical protein VIX73_10455 [Kofleriaceae bacterium]
MQRSAIEKPSVRCSVSPPVRRLLEPGGAQRRVELEPFKVVGRFTNVEQKNGKAASEAFKALERATDG